MKSSWLYPVLVICLILLLAAIVVEAFTRLSHYAAVVQVTEKPPLKRLIMADPPPWLSSAILHDLAQEAVDFTFFNKQHPEYAAELRDPMNGHILALIASIYTDKPAFGENAWIKKVNSVRRVWLPDQQVIAISADYRKPVGVVDLSGMYYLIDADAVRLPGAYPHQSLAALHWLIQIKGAQSVVPDAGSPFTSSDIQTALAMIKLLISQPYAGQIQAVDVSNLNGQVNPVAPQITLVTTTGGRVWWGVPPGKEGFYEVPATRKLASLLKIYQQYGHIDAGEPYVDIRGDQVLIPRSTSESSPTAPQ